MPTEKLANPGKGVAKAIDDIHALSVINLAMEEAKDGELSVARRRQLGIIAKEKPWMCQYAVAMFENVGLPENEAFKKQAELIKSDDAEVAQAGLRQYFYMTQPRQTTKIQVDSRHLHALVSTDDLGIEPRTIEEVEE